MKILYLNPGGQIGGAERVLLDLVSVLQAPGGSAEVCLVLGAGGPLVGTARAMGAAVRVVPFPPALAQLGDSGLRRDSGRLGAAWLRGAPAILRASASLSGYVQRLARVVREEAPDIVHSNGLKMHLLACWLRPRAWPLVWHIHDYVGRRPLMRRLLRLHAGRASAVVAISRSVAADFAAICPGRPAAACVFNGVDLKRFSPAGPISRLADPAKGNGGPVEKLRIGLVGTFARWKGHEVFLRALALLPRELRFRAYIVGAPVYETSGSQFTLEELQGLARRLGVGSRVVFTGFVRDTSAVMRALDVVVHASTAPEPFGLVIAEAMACGRPVIAAAHGGAAELVEAGVDALVHQPGDAAGLARCIRLLAGDASLRARLGRAARATALKRFDRRRTGAQMLSLYESLLEVSGQRRAA